MSFVPLDGHLYAFVSAVRISFYFKTSSTYYDQLQRIRINITEIKFEDQWYSYNAFINMLNTEYGYTTELAQTLIYQLTNIENLFDAIYITDGSNSGKYGNASGLLNCDIKLGDTVPYGSKGDTFTVRRISGSILSKLIQKLKGYYSGELNREYTYNLEFVPTRIYIYRQVTVPVGKNSYQTSFEKYKTINVTNFRITDLGTYTDLHTVDAVKDLDYWNILPENVVAGIPIGTPLRKMTTEVYMKVLAGSSSNVGGTYRYDDARFGLSNYTSFCNFSIVHGGDMYSSFRPYNGYHIKDSSSYSGYLQTSIFATSEMYKVHYASDEYFVTEQDTINFSNFINYNENDDSYSVSFTHTHKIIDDSHSNLGTTLPSNSLVCSVYVEGTLIDTFFASEDSKQYTYTFKSTSERKSINVVVTYNANTTLPEIDDNCTYAKSFNYISPRYLLVHSVNAGNFAFKVENSNVYIGNTSRFAEGMICAKGLAFNTKNEGYGIQVDNVLLFPDLSNKTRFSKALIIESEEVEGSNYGDAIDTIINKLNNSTYELYRFITAYNGKGTHHVNDASVPYVSFKYAALYKHPQFYNGGTYEEFANTLPEST